MRGQAENCLETGTLGDYNSVTRGQLDFGFNIFS